MMERPRPSPTPVRSDCVYDAAVTRSDGIIVMEPLRGRQLVGRISVEVESNGSKHLFGGN